VKVWIKNEMVNDKKKQINWALLIFDLAILAIAVGFSIWQNNPKYLWLILITFTTGSYIIKNE